MFHGAAVPLEGAMEAKTAFLQIRLNPKDKTRLERVAKEEHLDASTWARQVLLKELDRRGGTQGKAGA